MSHSNTESQADKAAREEAGRQAEADGNAERAAQNSGMVSDPAVQAVNAAQNAEAEAIASQGLHMPINQRAQDPAPPEREDAKTEAPKGRQARKD